MFVHGSKYARYLYIWAHITYLHLENSFSFNGYIKLKKIKNFPKLCFMLCAIKFFFFMLCANTSIYLYLFSTSVYQVYVYYILLYTSAYLVSLILQISYIYISRYILTIVSISIDYLYLISINNLSSIIFLSIFSTSIYIYLCLGRHQPARAGPVRYVEAVQ